MGRRVDPLMRLNGRQGKYVFKKALEPYLPDDVLYRKKMGFAVPLSAWFRGPLRERVRASLSGQRLAETGMFDMAYLEKLVDQHQTGGGEHSAVLWSLLMFESFLRQVHNTAPAQQPHALEAVPA